MMLLNHVLRKCTAGYQLSKSQKKINPLVYMDIKLFIKNEKELETLIQTVRIYSHDIEMEFGIDKSAMLEMKSRKQQTTEGIKLPKSRENRNSQRKRKRTNTWEYWKLTPSNK